MIVEMRTYKLKPGMRERFLQVFRTQSVPEHRRLGMKILGPSREPLKASFYEGELWKRELENVLMPMIDRYDVVLVEDPAHLIHW